MGRFIKVHDLGEGRVTHVHIEQIRMVYEPSDCYMRYWKQDKDPRADTKSCIDFGDGLVETVYTPYDVGELVAEIEKRSG